MTFSGHYLLAQSIDSAESGGLVGFATGLVERLGGPGAGLAVALENLFPPIPSEVILPLAGFVAGQGRMNVLAVIAWTTLGSVIGALALYLVGAALGRERLRAIVARIPLLKLDDLDRTEAWFSKHGGKAVFFGRMVPIFRSLISVPAGVERMRIATFLLYTSLGSAVWNTVFVLAGFKLGENWHVVEAYVGVFQNLVIAGSAIAVAVFVVVRLRAARRKRSTLERGSGRPSDGGRGTVYGKARRPADPT